MPFKNIIPPAAIVLVNSDLMPIVQEVLVKQLFIDRIMIGDEFDTAISGDPGFATAFKNSGKRLLIIRPFTELQNRNVVDVVIFCKEGLASVEYNKFGRPTFTIPIINMTFGELGIYSI